MNEQLLNVVKAMQKAEITPETLQVKDEIGKFMGLLNEYYQQYVSGELQLQEE